MSHVHYLGHDSELSEASPVCTSAVSDDSYLISWSGSHPPELLSGKGVVRLAADQIGGPIDKTIGHADISITGSSSPTDPPSVVYPWSISVVSPALPDEDDMYQLGLIFVFQTLNGGHTDIAAFFDLGAFLVV